MSNVYPSNSECIFCKIVAGDIPCHRVYECENTIAFLDINPLSRGHALVLPKGHWPSLDEVPDAIAAEIGLVLKRLSAATQQVTGCEGYNLLLNNGPVAGQEIPHVHFHIVPRGEGDGLGYRFFRGDIDSGDTEKLAADIEARAQGQGG
jgi:histidine triad (HIT) family protein